MQSWAVCQNKEGTWEAGEGRDNWNEKGHVLRISGCDLAQVWKLCLFVLVMNLAQGSCQFCSEFSSVALLNTMWNSNLDPVSLVSFIFFC